MVVLGVGLDGDRWPVGEFFLLISTIVSCTVSRSCSTSRCQGRRAASSPQRIPVSIPTSSSTRCRSGIAARSVSNWAGVIVSRCAVTTFGRVVRSSPAQALHNTVRFLQVGAQAVKLENSRSVQPQVWPVVESGVPVMGHLGLTQQSVNTLSAATGRRAGAAGDQLIEDAIALQEVGASSLVLEVVPSDLAERVSRELTIPTIGIGAGTDAQVLVWTDLPDSPPVRGPSSSRSTDPRTVLADAARVYADEVRTGTYPPRPGARLHLTQVSG